MTAFSEKLIAEIDAMINHLMGDSVIGVGIAPLRAALCSELSNLRSRMHLHNESLTNYALYTPTKTEKAVMEGKYKMIMDELNEHTALYNVIPAATEPYNLLCVIADSISADDADVAALMSELARVMSNACFSNKHMRDWANKWLVRIARALAELTGPRLRVTYSVRAGKDFCAFGTLHVDPHEFFTKSPTEMPCTPFACATVTKPINIAPFGAMNAVKYTKICRAIAMITRAQYPEIDNNTLKIATITWRCD